MLEPEVMNILHITKFFCVECFSVLNALFTLRVGQVLYAVGGAERAHDIV